MKRYTIGLYIFLTASITILASCKKVLDINEDPNYPAIENATPEVLLPSGEMHSAGMIGGQLAVAGGIWAQYWAQSATSSQYRDIDAYNITNTSEVVNSPYDQLFAGALADLVLAQQKSEERADWRYYLMSTVMKAYTYQVLVDLYDKVPYTEAFQASSGILEPKFDDGDFIYSSLLSEINNALSKDYTSKALTAEQKKTDFIFSGDMVKWTAFANTLKLKMYLRMVNAKPSEAQAGIQALYNSGATFLEEGAAVSAFENVPNQSNPLYEYNIRRLNTTTNIRASVTYSSWLRKNNDPRATAYFGTQSPIGINQGDYTASLTEQPNYPNSSVFVQSATDTVWFISKAESDFMQAEALERYFGGTKNGTTAAQKFNEGLGAAFAQIGLDGIPDDVSTKEDYVYPINGTFEQKLEKIIVQKWASLPGSHALEAFFERNRTGYPRTSAVYSTADTYVPGEFVYSKNGVTGQGNFPKRFPFPEHEKSRNSNTPTEVPITTKVWWAK